MLATTSHPGTRTASIPAGNVWLPGTLCWPEHPSGIVVFAHDTGSGQFCPRDRCIATRMCHEGLATLHFDLLTPREAGSPARAFDVALLARRIRAAAGWLATLPELKGLGVGVLGVGTGAAAALVAAAEAPDAFKALVLVEGRTDLAEYTWPIIAPPTLLIVGRRDLEALIFGREARDRLPCPNRLIEIPGATHGLGERGALEHAAACATEWFVHYLASEPAWHAADGTHHGYSVGHHVRKEGAWSRT